MADADQARKESEELTGAPRVRALLFDRLDRQGMARPKRMTVSEWDAAKDRLCTAFRHMSAENLNGLATLVTRYAVGKAHDQWPKEITLRSWGLTLQPPPARENEYVASLMRSRMGQTALEAGYHVDLFLLASKIGPPPGRYDLDRLRQRAEENQRRRETVRDRIDRGVASDDECAWLAWYGRAEAACLEIMGKVTA